MTNSNVIYQVLFLIDGSSNPYVLNKTEDLLIERSILQLLSYISDKATHLQWAYKFFNGRGKNSNLFKDFDELNVTEFLDKSKLQFKPILPKASLWLKTLQNSLVECISSFPWDEPDVLSSPVKSNTKYKKPTHSNIIFLFSDCPQSLEDIEDKFNLDNLKSSKIVKNLFSKTLMQRYKEEKVTFYWIDTSEIESEANAGRKLISKSLSTLKGLVISLRDLHTETSVPISARIYFLLNKYTPAPSPLVKYNQEQRTLEITDLKNAVKRYDIIGFSPRSQRVLEQSDSSIDVTATSCQSWNELLSILFCKCLDLLMITEHETWLLSSVTDYSARIVRMFTSSALTFKRVEEQRDLKDCNSYDQDADKVDSEIENLLAECTKSSADIESDRCQDKMKAKYCNSLKFKSEMLSRTLDNANNCYKVSRPIESNDQDKYLVQTYIALGISPWDDLHTSQPMDADTLFQETYKAVLRRSPRKHRNSYRKHSKEFDFTRTDKILRHSKLTNQNSRSRSSDSATTTATSCTAHLPSSMPILPKLYFSDESQYLEWVETAYRDTVAEERGVCDAVHSLITRGLDFILSTDDTSNQHLIEILEKNVLKQTKQISKLFIPKVTTTQEKIIKYEFHALLHIEICILDMEDDDKIELYMNEIVSLLRSISFLKEPDFLTSFLNDQVLDRYINRCSRLLGDIYNELMQPIPATLSCMLSPVQSSVEPVSSLSILSNEDFTRRCLDLPTESQLSQNSQNSNVTRVKALKRNPSLCTNTRQLTIELKPSDMALMRRTRSNSSFIDCKIKSKSQSQRVCRNLFRMDSISQRTTRTPPTFDDDDDDARSSWACDGITSFSQGTNIVKRPPVASQDYRSITPSHRSPVKSPRRLFKSFSSKSTASFVSSSTTGATSSQSAATSTRAFQLFAGRCSPLHRSASTTALTTPTKRATPTKRSQTPSKRVLTPSRHTTTNCTPPPSGRKCAYFTISPHKPDHRDDDEGPSFKHQTPKKVSPPVRPVKLVFDTATSSYAASFAAVKTTPVKHDGGGGGVRRGGTFCREILKTPSPRRKRKRRATSSDSDDTHVHKRKLLTSSVTETPSRHQGKSGRVWRRQERKRAKLDNVETFDILESPTS